LSSALPRLKPLWRVTVAYLLRGILAAGLCAAAIWGGGQQISGALGAMIGVVAVVSLAMMLRRMRLDTDEGGVIRRHLIGAYASLIMLVLALALAAAASGQNPWWTMTGRTAVFVFLASWIFVAMLQIVRMLLWIPWRPLAVARTVLDEALAQRVVIAVIVLMFIVIASIAMSLASSDLPVRYRVQAFLSWTQMAVFVMLAGMTVLLACWTLCAEIRDHQIYHVAVKPIGRGSYLMGKWIGLGLLNFMLVVIAGIAIYIFTVHLLADPTAAVSRDDRISLEKKVLVARQQIKPTVPPIFGEKADQIIDKTIEDDPEFVARRGGRNALREEIYNGLIYQWMAVEPLTATHFPFDGLAEIRENAVAQAKANRQKLKDAQVRGDKARLELIDVLQFRFKSRWQVPPNWPAFDEITVTPFAGGRPLMASEGYWRIHSDRFSEERIPASFIEPKTGRLIVSILHQDADRRKTIPVTISLSDLELRYKIGEFGPNLGRTMLVLWIKLSFLAMLGLGCASLLSFPVATMLAVVVFVICWIVPTLTEAVAGFSIDNENLGFLEWLIKGGGGILTTIFRPFSAYAPEDALVDGRYFSWAEVGACFLWISVGWTTACGIAGGLILRKRELARVQV
jgi:hypothetical protein